jgi:hypothetical protein
MSTPCEPSRNEDQPAVRVESVSTRWRNGILMATFIAGLIGIILGYLALLPFFLGVFFFLLLGQLPGAVLFRYGDPIRPLSSRQLWLAGIPVVVIMWVVAGFVEYRAMPGQLAEKVRKCVTGGYPAGYERAAMDSYVRAWVVNEFYPKYGCCGLVAYVRWAGSRGWVEFPAKPIALSRPGASTTQPVTLYLGKAPVHQLNQPGILWIIRIVASTAMLVLGTFLQIGPLSKPDVRASSADGPADPPATPANPA